MAKKTKISVERIIFGIVALLGIVAICMIFAKNVNIEVKSSNSNISFSLDGGSYSGADVTFGKENYFDFSFMNLLTYILVLASVVLSILKVTNVLKGNISEYIIAALLLVAGIFFFCTGAFTIISSGVSITKSLAVGAILGGIFSLAGCVLSVLPVLLKKSK